MEKIKLNFCNDRVYIWDSNDAVNIRMNHRIIGTCIGSLPESPHQNSEFGLPLLLMPEEVTLLIENGIAEIVMFDTRITEDIQLNYNKLKEEFNRKSHENFRAQRKDTILRIADRIAIGKYKKLVNCEEIDTNDEEFKSFKEKVINEEMEKIGKFTADSCAVQIYTKCPFENRIENPIVWKFPSNIRENVKYFVYRDLWRKKFYITNGFKFGCDFLVYDGDPFAFHSRFMVICKSPDESISDLQLQIHGRLAKSVKKSVLIAMPIDTFDNNSDVRYNKDNTFKVEYLTIEWNNTKME